MLKQLIFYDIFSLLHRQLSPKCQMMFFSATYDRSVMDFAEHIVKNPIIIRLKREQESLDNIKQYYVKCRDQEQKYQAIQNIYGVITVGQAIIFCHVSGSKKKKKPNNFMLTNFR